MGFFAEINATLLKPNNSTRLSNLVAVGVMTGYCGSTTTFSSWQYDSMYALLTAQVGTFFLREIIGFCVSYYALLFGHDMAALMIVPTYNTIVIAWKKKDKTLIQEFKYMSSALTWVWRITTILFVVANVILTALFIALLSSPLSQTTRIVSAAMLFSPLGCILRFLFSILNVKFGPKIPIFTLCSNLLATVIVGFFKVTDQRYTSISGKEALNVFFVGVSAGFCGCLSTVSSLVEELHTKLTDVRWRYLYLLLTFVLPCLALLAIVGPFLWTE
jgi:CrcB protein